MSKIINLSLLHKERLRDFIILLDKGMQNFPIICYSCRIGFGNGAKLTNSAPESKIGVDWTEVKLLKVVME